MTQKEGRKNVVVGAGGYRLGDLRECPSLPSTEPGTRKSTTKSAKDTQTQRRQTKIQDEDTELGIPQRMWSQ